MKLQSSSIKIETTPKPQSITDEWKEYKNKNGTDFILDEADRLMKLAGDDPDIKAGVYTTIVGLLFEYKREHVRDFYLKTLGRRFKPMKIWKDEYKILKEFFIEQQEADNAPSDNADTTTLEKLGFYTEDDKYWFSGQSGFVEGTNFIIEPLFHIYSITNNRRLIRIKNEYGYSILCDVPSDAMVSVDRFQNFLFSEGNFLIFINNQQFKKLLRYIGEKFPKCFEIKTFGWQPEGFFAFADGSYNSQFTAVDEMGIMEHKGKNYFSPAFSEVYSELRADDDIYENDRRFIYRKSNTTMDEWTTIMQRVYAFGNNGQYGIAYLVAAVFRSTIYNLYKIFPHLFLHGEKGSGKSQLGWSLSNMFQNGTPPFNLSSGTDVAFFRWLARYRDVIIWYDEYTDAIDEKRFQALKSAFDGVGREKGKMSKDSRTESDKINSAAVISGQHLPQRDDNSLYSRSLVRFFVKPKDGYSNKQIRDYDTLKRMEEEGLSQIITQILDQRHIIEKRFARTFSNIFEYFKDILTQKGESIDDRILRNYTILATAVWIFQKDTPIDLNINPELFRDMCMDDAIEQNDKIASSDALGTFWKIIGSLIQDGELTKIDYDIQDQHYVTVTYKQSGQKQLKQINFEGVKNILYLDFDRAYQKYMEEHRKIFSTIGLGLQTTIDYAHNHWSYIGLQSSHYFRAGNGKRTSAHMFDYDLLIKKGVLPDFNNVLPENNDEKPDNSWMGDKKEPETKTGDLKFEGGITKKLVD